MRPIHFTQTGWIKPRPQGPWLPVYQVESYPVPCMLSPVARMFMPLVGPLARIPVAALAD